VSDHRLQTDRCARRILAFASWTVDYLKLDGCNADIKDYDTGYPAMEAALNATGFPIAYSCSWPAYQEDSKMKPNYAAIAASCNLWRNWDDIDDSWSSVYSIIQWFGDNQDRLSPFHGPGHWNDPDMVSDRSGSVFRGNKLVHSSIDRGG
jgi:hypothetical protein